MLPIQKFRRLYRESIKQFTLIFPFNITPFQYPRKSAGESKVTVILRSRAADYDSAVISASAEFGSSLYVVAAFEGWPKMATSGYEVNSVQQLKNFFPPISEPNPR